MPSENIVIVPFGFFDNSITGEILQDIERVFSLPVYTREGYLDLSEFYDPTRNQYDGNRLLRALDSNYANDNAKTLGLFDVDLFIPILTYIFGQAFLNGRCGIASVYRFKNERYGLPPDEKAFLDRIRKEVIHELGHTFGLIHCQDPDCVMHSSTYVEDIDQKNFALCPRCHQSLNNIPS